MSFIPSIIFQKQHTSQICNKHAGLSCRSMKLSWLARYKLHYPTSSFTTRGCRSYATRELPLEATENDLFRYTGGRWLWNEEAQLSRRYVKFNLKELANAATQAVGSQSCVAVKKLPEGNFNKVFLMTMDDGKEVIAKLPNPNAGRPCFTTASEVATMSYVREALDIPAPKVYTWNSTTENPVGAEFIIMERARGIELDKVWDNLLGPEKFEIIKRLVEFEKRAVSVKFPMLGSLYFANDLVRMQPEQAVKLDSNHATFGLKYAVGPTTNRAFFDQGRDAITTHQGPWSTVQDYLKSRLEQEIGCIRRNSVFPGQQGLFSGPGQYQPTAHSKLRVLLEYEKVASLILPRDNALSKPVLWHADLHTDNIFVNPERPTEISCIIDWQAVNLSPLFLQARHPALIEFDGPIPDSFKVDLPENFEELGPEDQLKAKKLRAAQSLYKLYEIQLLRQCPEVQRALRFRDSLLGQITGISGSIFSDGEPILQGMLIRLQDEWSEHIGDSVSCPLSFTDQDRTQQKEDEEKWGAGVELMHDVLEAVGAYQGWDGWVNHNNYNKMKERLQLVQDQFLSHHARNDDEKSKWMKAWPFVDRVN